jgi:hypothetical protein
MLATILGEQVKADPALRNRPAALFTWYLQGFSFSRPYFNPRFTRRLYREVLANMDETALNCLETGGDQNNLAGAANTRPAPSKSTDDIHLTRNDMLETVPESSTSIQSEDASRQTLLPLYQASLLVEKMNCSYFFDERSLIGLSDEQGKNTSVSDYMLDL